MRFDKNENSVLCILDFFLRVFFFLFKIKTTSRTSVRPSLKVEDSIVKMWRWHVLAILASGLIVGAVVEDIAAPWKLLDTVAVGDKYLLPNASGNTFTFRPAKSCLQNISDSITPDVEGIYSLTNNITNTTWHLHAVNLQDWSRGMVPLLTDVFGTKPLFYSGGGKRKKVRSCELQVCADPASIRARSNCSGSCERHVHC